MFKRVNSDVVPFSINSPAGNRYAFGTTDVSNDIDVNYNENIKKGFGTGPNEFPELEDFNALMFTGSYLAAYLYQAGIPEWNDKQKYYINSIAMGSDGNIYKSLAGTEEIPNVNNNPTLAGSIFWKSILSEYALINGDETKKFKVADATAQNEAVNKKQLDKAIADLNTEIKITGTVSFNSTTNNIELTNIVTVLGLEIGDVIQISGAEDTKNNSEFTVEVITDSNNIIVNQAHANQGTSKNVANRSGDTGVTIKLLAKYYNAPTGLGQGWVQTNKNSLNVLFVNNTNREIEVTFQAQGSISNRLYFSVLYDDSIPLELIVSQNALSSQYHILSGQVTYDKNFKIVNNSFITSVNVYEKR